MSTNTVYDRAVPTHLRVRRINYINDNLWISGRPPTWPVWKNWFAGTHDPYMYHSWVQHILFGNNCEILQRVSIWNCQRTTRRSSFTNFQFSSGSPGRYPRGQCILWVRKDFIPSPAVSTWTTSDSNYLAIIYSVRESTKYGRDEKFGLKFMWYLYHILYDLCHIQMIFKK